MAWDSRSCGAAGFEPSPWCRSRPRRGVAPPESLGPIPVRSGSPASLRPSDPQPGQAGEPDLRDLSVAGVMSRSRTAGSRATIGRCFSPVFYPGPALRISGGPSHGPIDPQSDRSARIAERVPTARDPIDFGPIPGAGGGTEAIPDRDRPVPDVEPRVDRSAPPGTHRPALPLMISEPPGDATPARRVRGIGDSAILTFALPPIATRSRPSRSTGAWPCGTWRAAGAQPSWTTRATPWPWRSHPTADGWPWAASSLTSSCTISGPAGRGIRWGCRIQCGEGLAFSTDGRTLAATSYRYHEILLLDLAVGKERAGSGVTARPSSAWHSPPMAVPGLGGSRDEAIVL